MRVAIYARFSDEKQNPRSCDDQIALCQAHAVRRGWEVVAIFRDEAISGFATANRPGINTALAAAKGGAFEVLLAEDESRISRNLGQLATMRDELAMAGVRFATLETDNVELMHVAFKGAFAQQYLIDLGHKTRRGVRANAEKGLATGAKLYGYDTQPGGQITIDEEQAEVIRRIHGLFADYRLGGREIADILNREHVPGPRGGYWNASTILGERKRGNGILRSEIYAGVKVWGRDEVKKDLRTGARVHHYKPPEEWNRTEVEHLRIVPAELWERTQARLAETAAMSLSAHGNRRKPGVFSGLLKCSCGASYTLYRRNQLICASNRERGPSVCPNNKVVDRALVERRVLDGLQERMLSPEAVSIYVKKYHDVWQALEKERRDRRRLLEKRQAELTRQIERLVDAICDGSATKAMKERLVAYEAEKEDVEAALGEANADAEPPFEFHPNTAKAYAKMVRELSAVLAEIQADQEQAALNRKLIDAVRGLIIKVEIIPDASAPGGVNLRLHGELARLMKTPEGEHPPNNWRSRSVAGGGIGRAPPSVPYVFFRRG